MARDIYAYREVAVQLGPHGIHPMPGQAFAPTLAVHCGRPLRDYPAGTCFLLNAKLTDRLGGEPYLYTWHGDPVVVLDAAAAKKFLAAFRRGRI
ncbi:MAG: hypothetical protein V4463_24960 [Pseudomonadota bacterium]